MRTERAEAMARLRQAENAAHDAWEMVKRHARDQAFAAIEDARAFLAQAERALEDDAAVMRTREPSA